MEAAGSIWHKYEGGVGVGATAPLDIFARIRVFIISAVLEMRFPERCDSPGVLRKPSFETLDDCISDPWSLNPPRFSR